jgi:hypothetical protein
MKWRAAALTQPVETTVSESKVNSSVLISGRNSALRNGALVQTKSTMINAKEPHFQNLAETRRTGETDSPRLGGTQPAFNGGAGGGDMDVATILSTLPQRLRDQVLME